MSAATGITVDWVMLVHSWWEDERTAMPFPEYLALHYDRSVLSGEIE